METSRPEFWTPFSCEDAARVSTPALLLSGSDTLPMFTLVVDELERCLPNRERAIIAGSSHDLPAGNPGAFNDTVLRFLVDHASEAGGRPPL